MNRRELHREAHRLVDLGYRLVPIRYGGKTPLVRWKDLESGHRAVDRWMGRFGAMNLAVHTGSSGIVGLDADTDRAAEWIAGNCPETPMVCRTPRGGIHAYFRAPEDPPPPAVNLFGIGLDVRSRRSILVVSPSWSAEHRRSWEWRDGVVRPCELPLLAGGPLRREPRARGLVVRSPPAGAVRGFATSPGGSCASSRSRGRTGAGSASRSPAGSSTPGSIGTAPGKRSSSGMTGWPSLRGARKSYDTNLKGRSGGFAEGLTRGGLPPHFL
jgi:hypothetical protein